MLHTFLSQFQALNLFVRVNNELIKFRGNMFTFIIVSYDNDSSNDATVSLHDIGERCPDGTFFSVPKAFPRPKGL